VLLAEGPTVDEDSAGRRHENWAYGSEGYVQGSGLVSGGVIHDVLLQVSG